MSCILFLPVWVVQVWLKQSEKTWKSHQRGSKDGSAKDELQMSATSAGKAFLPSDYFFVIKSNADKALANIKNLLLLAWIGKKKQTKVKDFLFSSARRFIFTLQSMFRFHFHYSLSFFKTFMNFILNGSWLCWWPRAYWETVMLIIISKSNLRLKKWKVVWQF